MTNRDRLIASAREWLATVRKLHDFGWKTGTEPHADTIEALFDAMDELSDRVDVLVRRHEEDLAWKQRAEQAEKQMSDLAEWCDGQAKESWHNQAEAAFREVAERIRKGGGA